MLKRNLNLIISLSDAPRAVTITPPSVAVLEGHPINIQCSADAFPAPSYTWTYPPNESSAGPLLSVASATVEHNGLFVCTATNAMGSTKKEIRINVICMYLIIIIIVKIIKK